MLKNKACLQKIQNIQKAEPENKITPPTAKSAKRGFDSFGSTLGGHVREKKVPASRAKKRPRQKIRLVTRMMVETWRVGRAWILEHLGKLEVTGWTRHELLRAGRFRYPCGTWGSAFTGPWAQKGVKIEVEASGAIVWAWKDATAGRSGKEQRGFQPLQKPTEGGQPNDSK